ncbi:MULTISPECIES: hypothetical protein [Spirulina sp. CCY15215]|uniref:hypothetical protein n=1 Tax=Spirulina sp. CCY15215 TaxID=2767591 RepID=UPI00194F839A|nr:hypothetical protein [Spirulina major]
MPFRKFDSFDEKNKKKGQYQYQNAGQYFQLNDLSIQSREVLSILQSFGTIATRGWYYGGGDEGFSHFIEAEFPTHVKKENELLDLLVDTPLGDKDSPLISKFTFTEKKPSRQTVISHRLHWFTDEMVILLLGKSFGVGDTLTIKGSFKVDFEQGIIIDEYQQGLLVDVEGYE